MLKQFGWGKLLLSVGWLLIYIRSDLSDLLSINCANSLVLVSCYFESAAILSLIRKNPEKCYRAQFIITATAVFIFNITAFCAESINARILCMNVSVFMIYIIPVVNFFRERQNNFFRTFYGVCYVFFEIIIVVKMFYNVTHPQEAFFTYTSFESLFFACQFLLTLVGTVGFLLLAKESQNVKIQKLLDDRNQFFSIIAHDLRGPLVSSVRLSDLFIQDFEQYSTTEIKDTMVMLHESNENTYKLLDHLLDWAGLQNGSIESRPVKISLQDLIIENKELCRNIASNRNITITFKTAQQIWVYGDKNMFNIVVRNLLTNAIKFTPRGGIVTIATQIIKKNALVSILDSGIGMSEETKQGVFKLTKKILHRGTENENGSGLGLLLCKEFVNRNNGDIWFESEVGKGSNFTFTIPLADKRSTLKNSLVNI